MLVVLMLLAKSIYSNLYCQNTCKSCLSGYNYLSLSCLKYCPSGYFIDGQLCTQNKSQTLNLFKLNFVSFRKIEDNSIQGFSHPNGYSFRNLSRVTPIATLDRGFYFFSSSYLVSNFPWILAPSFCITAYFKAFSAGKIFEVTYNSTTYLLVNFNNSKTDVSILYLNLTLNKNEVFVKSYPTNAGEWKMIIFTLIQQNDQIYLKYELGIHEFKSNWEFRMDTNQAVFSIGAPNNSTFQGFLAYLNMENSDDCSGNFLLSNMCGFNEYLSGDLCIKCSNFIPEVLFCTRNSSNLCFSNRCSSCQSYMFENCSEDSTENLSVIGRNCKIGSYFNCYECNPGFNLSQGLCINPVSNNSSIILRLDYFTEFQGGYFQSGVNSSTYSPFNSPELDDPIALSKRGYYFTYTRFMKANSLVLNHSFTVTIWAYMNSRFFLNSKKLKLLSDSSIVLTMANHELVIEEYVSGNCSTGVWSFFGASVEWLNNSTHIRTICGKNISKIFSVPWFAFYDVPEEKKILTEYTNNLVYRVTFSQFVLNNFNDLLTICSTAGDITCLGFPSIVHYKNIMYPIVPTCHSSCTRGCSTWGTCNQCRHIQCKSCENFDDDCDEDITFMPCVGDFQLSEDKKTCCNKRCAKCYGYTSYSCTKCASNYVLVGVYCDLDCPAGYTLNGTICEPPISNVLLNATFNIIADNFRDFYGNQIFTGNSQDFYPKGAYYDPIPTKSRGYYFKNHSFIYTSNFKIPINFTFSFWMWQITPGILLTKDSLQINSTFVMKYLNLTFKIKENPIQTWFNFIIGGYSVYYYYRFWARNNNNEYAFADSSDIDFHFDENYSSIYIGASSNGFVGFLWRFVIYNNYKNFNIEYLITCNQTFVNSCYWNCSLDYYIDNNSCQPCLSNCKNGCVRSTDCNLCYDPACYQCEYFNNSCKNCIENATKKSSCECNSGFYWSNSSVSCMPCIEYCSKCNSSSICQECNTNFILINDSCYCKSRSYINGTACLPCHELCEDCNGPSLSSCISCSSDKMLDNGYCTCRQGYLLGLNCLACPYGCSECLNSTFCTSCLINFLKIDQNNSCPNLNYSNTGCCEKCHESCNTCNGSSEYDCLSCGLNQKLTPNYNCICNDSFYHDGKYCIYCDSLKNMQIYQNSCICKEGFYYDSQNCIACHNSCKTCNGSTELDCFLCQTGLVKSQNLCLCQASQYWNGKNCEICNISQNLVADKFKCKCIDGYFQDINGICMPCNLKCRTCTGKSESECLTCNDHSFLNSSQCFCKDGFYSINLTCLPCPPNCKKCTGPQLKDCLCEINNIWTSCNCDKKMFWNITCHSCHPSCEECSGSEYFMCTRCEFYHFRGLCYRECPRGLKVAVSECILSHNLSLSFHFDSKYPLIERISQKHAILISNDSKSQPFSLENRGIFFPENSENIIFETFPMPLVSPTFFISIWLKVIQTSDVFLIKSSDDFSIRFSILEKARFYLILNKNNIEVPFGASLNFSNWHNYVFGIVYDSNHFFIPILDGIKNNFIGIILNPYKDESSSVLSFGSLNEQMFSGFVYSFEIFTSEPLSEFLFIPQNGECEISPPSLTECLNNCLENEYFLGKTCEKCDNKCIYGCVDATNCSPCLQENCEICRVLSDDFCLQCKPSYTLENGHCISCKDSEYLDTITRNCKSCPSLCLSCSNQTHCFACVENSTIVNSSYCNCNFGFEIKDGRCRKRYFESTIKISISNSFTIYFDDELKDPLNIKDISIKIIPEVVKFSLFMKNISLYIVKIIENGRQKSYRDKYLNIEFSENIISIHGASLKTHIFRFKMFNSEEQVIPQDLERIENSGKTLTIISLASGVLLMNPTVFFNLLNLVEMFSYTLLFDIKFHNIFIQFMLDLKQSTKLPSFKLPINQKGEKLKEKYVLFDVESTLLMINSGFMIISLFSVVVITIIAHAISFIKFDKLSAICNRVKKILFFRWFYRLFIQNCFDFTIFCFLSLKYSEITSMIGIFDFFLCFVIMVNYKQMFMMICFLINIYIVNKMAYPLTRSNIDNRISYFACIFEEFECTNSHKCLFYLIFTARRVVLSILIVFSNQILQLCGGISFCLMVIDSQNIFYLIITKPFAVKKENYFMFINELLLLIFYMLFFLAEIQMISKNPENLALQGIRLVTATLAFNTFVNIIKGVTTMVLKIRSKILQSNSKVIPTENLTSTQKVVFNEKLNE